MTNALTITSRAAIVAAALAVPALPALAQTPPPAGDAARTTAADTAAPDATTGGTTDAPAAGTPAADVPGLGGTVPGASDMAPAGLSADQPDYRRLLSDLRTGRDFAKDLDGLDDAASVTVLPLSALQGRDGASTPGMAGDVPAGAADMAPDMATGSPAPDAPTAEAPAADAPAMDGAATGMPGSGIAGETPPGLTTGGYDDLDSALEQSEGLTDMRAALADDEAVSQALEDAGHDTDDVIGLYREGDQLTVIVDDRDD